MRRCVAGAPCMHASGYCTSHMLTTECSVHSQAFSPDGETLISGSDDMQIIFWDWQSSASLLATAAPPP